MDDWKTILSFWDGLSSRAVLLLHIDIRHPLVLKNHMGLEAVGLFLLQPADSKKPREEPPRKHWTWTPLKFTYPTSFVNFMSFAHNSILSSCWWFRKKSKLTFTQQIYRDRVKGLQFGCVFLPTVETKQFNLGKSSQKTRWSLIGMGGLDADSRKRLRVWRWNNGHDFTHLEATGHFLWGVCQRRSYGDAH